MPGKSDGRIGNYKSSDIPLSRIPSIDVLEMGARTHHVQALLDVDVTDARHSIKDLEISAGKKISFTAWIVHCISKSIEAHQHINSYTNLRKRKLITFEDIDITVLIEKEVEGEKVPVPYVIRRTNEKSLEEISA